MTVAHFFHKIWQKDTTSTRFIMKKLILFASLLSAPYTFAGELDRFSTEELMEEVGRRVDILADENGGSINKGSDFRSRITLRKGY